MKTVGEPIELIYKTTNYDLFRKMEDNRDVIEQRKQKLMCSIQKKDILNPIIVNENYEIADGQGRFEARKALGLPILYVMQEGLTIDDCRLMNSTNKPWGQREFIESYKHTNENYQNLDRVMQETGASIGMAMRYGNKSNSGKGVGAIETGTLIYTKEDADKAIAAAKHVKDVKNALMLNSKVKATFCVAVKICYETQGYNPDRIVRACKKNRQNFLVTNFLEDQLKEFSRVYNNGYKPESRLYFEDYMRNRGSNVRDYSKDERKHKDVSTLKK